MRVFVVEERTTAAGRGRWGQTDALNKQGLFQPFGLGAALCRSAGGTWRWPKLLGRGAILVARVTRQRVTPDQAFSRTFRGLRPDQSLQPAALIKDRAPDLAMQYFIHRVYAKSYIVLGSPYQKICRGKMAGVSFSRRSCEQKKQGNSPRQMVGYR